MKKIIIILSLFVLCTVVYANPDDFIISREGIITAYEGWDVDIVIPSQINGIQVIGIGNRVFQSMGITSVTFPSGLNFIYSEAFANNRITRVSLPDGVFIYDRAFSNNQITSVSIPDGATVYNQAFSNNQITGVIIGNDAVIFDNAVPTGRLTNITIGTNNNISADVFGLNFFYDYLSNNRSSGTYALRSHPSRTSGDYTFLETQYGAVITGYRGSEFNRLVIPSELNGIQVKGIGNGAFSRSSWDNSNRVTRMQLPSGIVFIGNSAFSNNLLTNITIPNTITYIGISAFINNQLTNVTIPENIVYIGSSAFSGNPLENITRPGYKVIVFEMWDSYRDGWDGDGALYVGINDVYYRGIKAHGSDSRDYYFVKPGDQILIYWNEGSSQSENAFAVYYLDNPPNPAYNPSSSANISGNILLNRQYGSLSNAAQGQLLGSFTVR